MAGTARQSPNSTYRRSTACDRTHCGKGTCLCSDGADCNSGIAGCTGHPCCTAGSSGNEVKDV